MAGLTEIAGDRNVLLAAVADGSLADLLADSVRLLNMNRRSRFTTALTEVRAIRDGFSSGRSYRGWKPEHCAVLGARLEQRWVNLRLWEHDEAALVARAYGGERTAGFKPIYAEVRLRAGDELARWSTPKNYTATAPPFGTFMADFVRVASEIRSAYPPCPLRRRVVRDVWQSLNNVVTNDLEAFAGVLDWWRETTRTGGAMVGNGAVTSKTHE